MKILVLVLLAVLLARPVAAADVTCAEWQAYRAGDTSLQGQAHVFAAFLQGYIDAANEYSELVQRQLDHLALFQPGRSKPGRDNFVPPQFKFEDTAASLDRLCSVYDPTDSAREIGMNDIKTEMAKRAGPIIVQGFEKLRGSFRPDQYTIPPPRPVMDDTCYVCGKFYYVPPPGSGSVVTPMRSR